MTIVTDVIRDFEFVGSQRLKRLRAELEPRLEAFEAGWWHGVNTLKLVDVCEFYTESSLYHDYRIFRNIRFGDENIIFVGDSAVWHELFSSLFEGESLESDELEHHILQRLCQDFCRRMVPDADGESISVDDHDESVNRYGSGCVALEMDVRGIPVSVLLTRGIWKGLLGPVKTEPSKGVQPLNSAVGPQNTLLRAYFKASDIPCESVMDLKPGDFIPLGQDFTGVVSVSCGSQPDLFAAVLGKTDENRAIKIT
ncbi:FliM/FliN family flagellar motor switch protein [Microbulbifer sp. YPW16]|uniref:FliM/FliN family flagellar motor switch protein n=1 Tax=Microbulbifer sp. YPW16 TaxID=2904242 RepID=UPI001E4F8676|nr:FliM/FliN family flagellar motor C-terminal domain-containing protein [Microbulbifer sp. YPW16]UHQ56888.1 FliM/FliN family flagellar motor C-terminal domain-containing protein [Microbulbifer sp. YPW16]